MLPTKSTSTPKIAPAIGVPKTAAKPAEIPQITSFLRSPSSSRKRLASNDDSPAPIWAHGPSFPAEPPQASVTIVASNLTGTTLALIRPDEVCIASITFSVPCPSASGASFLTSTTLIKNAIGRSRKYSRERPARSTLQPRILRKSAVDAPTTPPAAVARANHFRTLTNRTDCSVSLVPTMTL